MATVLAVLEQRDGALKKVSLEVLAAAREAADASGATVAALVMGAKPEADELGRYGADSVISVGDESLKLYQAGLYAGVVADVARADGAIAVIMACTSLGRDLGPRVAARLGAPLAADVTGIASDGGVSVTRPVYAGKAIETVKLSGVPVISVRPNTFAPVEHGKSASIDERPMPEGLSSRARTVKIEEPENASLDVAEAAIVVSGGRGLKEPENFKLVEDLAAAFGGGAAVGASRAVVDAGWRPHAEQVGQTGKTVSPGLYIAVGISGAIQHLAGMKTSKCIVAINRDKDAPIFKVADYGIVGDLFEIVPRLTEEIAKVRQS